MYKIIIDNDNSEFTKKLSTYLYNNLKKNNLEVELININNDPNKINYIKNKYGINNNIIIISNRITKDKTYIIYALRNSDEFSKKIENNFNKINYPVDKYYQLRNKDNTYLDDDFLIKNTKNNETIVIYYNPDYNKLEIIAKSLSNSIYDYLNIENNNDYYIVKKGDTLYSIAKKYNTTVDNLKNLNNLKNNNISINQKLKINDNINTYVVKKGDTLWKISNIYNTTVDNLKKLNNLKNNNLFIGQILKIPKINRKYIVKKGDTLYSIAKKLNTSINNIKQLNNINNNLINIGDVLLY